MTDLRDVFDAAIDILGREARARHWLDQAAADERNARPKCGNCYWWMKSRDCPRERNVNGRNRGPSMNEAPCGKFREDPSPHGPQFLRARAVHYLANAERAARGEPALEWQQTPTRPAGDGDARREGI